MGTKTSGANRTDYFSPATWQGRKILLSSERDIFHCVHEVERLGNYGTPTGIIWCPKCGGIAEEQADAREA